MSYWCQIWTYISVQCWNLRWRSTIWTACSRDGANTVGTAIMVDHTPYLATLHHYYALSDKCAKMHYLTFKWSFSAQPLGLRLRRDANFNRHDRLLPQVCMPQILPKSCFCKPRLIIAVCCGVLISGSVTTENPTMWSLNNKSTFLVFFSYSNPAFRYCHGKEQETGQRPCCLPPSGKPHFHSACRISGVC